MVNTLPLDIPVTSYLTHCYYTAKYPQICNRMWASTSCYRPVCEFLSDALFFGLSLWTEFKLANRACASGWWTSTFEVSVWPFL